MEEEAAATEDAGKAEVTVSAARAETAAVSGCLREATRDSKPENEYVENSEEESEQVKDSLYCHNQQASRSIPVRLMQVLKDHYQ